jgi:hypothetical protein
MRSIQGSGTSTPLTGRAVVHLAGARVGHGERTRGACRQLRRERRGTMAGAGGLALWMRTTRDSVRGAEQHGVSAGQWRRK